MNMTILLDNLEQEELDERGFQEWKADQIEEERIEMISELIAKDFFTQKLKQKINKKREKRKIKK